MNAMLCNFIWQRIMLLYERGEYREAAAFIRRVSSPTYRQIVTELPIDRFVDAMPHSMPVLEAIYAKVGMVCFCFHPVRQI